MMRARRLFALLVGCTLLAGAATAQDDGAAWTVEAVNPLALSSSANARIFPAPDGRLAVYHSSIRLNGHIDNWLTLTTAEPGDEPFYIQNPDEPGAAFESDSASVYAPFAWSPDSTRVAVVRQPLLTFTDSDLWLFNVDDERWQPLTDDGYDGSILPSEAVNVPEDGYVIDLQPAWSPDGATIAVERTAVNGDGAYGPTTLTLVDAETSETKDVVPLPGSGDDVSDLGATTALSWSPDSAQVAMTVRHQTLDEANDGLWIADIETGDVEQRATVEQLTEALHSIYPNVELLTIGPVFWSPAGNTLLLWIGNASITPIVAWPFLVDVESGDITPVPVPAHPNDTPDRRGLRPIQAAWSPDGTALIMFTFGAHPDEDRTSLDPANASVRGGVRIVDVMSGESTLLGYLPQGPALPYYYASWGSDGDVIIDGYHLVLSPSE